MPGRALPNILPSTVLQPPGMEEPPGTNPTACRDRPLSQPAQSDSEAGSWPGASALLGTESSRNRVPQWWGEEQLEKKVPEDHHGTFFSSLRGQEDPASSPVLSQTWTPLDTACQHSSQPGMLARSNPCSVFAWGGSDTLVTPCPSCGCLDAPGQIIPGAAPPSGAGSPSRGWIPTKPPQIQASTQAPRHPRHLAGDTHS